MTISLNGETVDPRGAENIAELVERYHLRSQCLLIEHNGLALHQHEWAERALAQGDCIEIVRVVAGG